MKEAIRKLIALQQMDQERAGLHAKIAEMEAGLEARKQAIAEKEAAIDKCQATIASLEQRQREYQGLHEDAQARIKDRQARIMQVQTSREHQALLKEIEENKRLLKDTEEKALAAMERIEALKEEMAQLQQDCQDEQGLLGQESDMVAKEVKKIKREIKKLDGQRQSLAEEIEPVLIARYAKLVEKRNGTAVVEARQGVCMGCFMSIPPQQLNEIMLGDQLHLCPTCQRILYVKTTEETAAEA